MSPDRLTRARWLAARTRNAARHGLLIATVSCLTTLVAILTFVLVPRQVDRALALALGDLPAPRDTQTLLLDWQTAMRHQEQLQSRADSVRRMALFMAAAPSGDSVTGSRSTTADGALSALQQALERARQAPLVESYRTLVQETVLRQDTRARAALDTIEQVHREREAYAALGGPDARYAALTARLTRLGDRLLAIGTEQLRQATRQPASGDTGALSGLSGGMPADTTDSGQAVRTGDAGIVGDSALDAEIRRAIEVTRLADSSVDAARQFNQELGVTREEVRARVQLAIPPVAALLASLVLGVSVGFATALVREIRRPKVGEAQELEWITGARVIVHHEQARTRVADGLTGGHEESDAWPMLHLTLTNIGDVSREVEVLSDQPMIAAAVAIHLAAIAARESRETVLVDQAERGGSLRALLPAPSLQRADAHADAHAALHWDTTRAIALGGDTAVDLMRARSAAPVHRQREAAARSSSLQSPTGAGPSDGPRSARDELDALLASYDFAVLVADRQGSSVARETADVVLVARLGATPLAWIGQAQRHVQQGGRRVRAVIMWTGALPLVG